MHGTSVCGIYVVEWIWDSIQICSRCNFYSGEHDGLAGWVSGEKEQPCHGFWKIYGSDLVEKGALAAWIVIIIIGREFIISGFRLVASDKGVVIAASYWGKFKTVSQMLMVILLILDLGGAFNVAAQVLIWIAVILTVVSLVDYLVKNRSVLAGEM